EAGFWAPQIVETIPRNFVARSLFVATCHEIPHARPRCPRPYLRPYWLVANITTHVIARPTCPKCLNCRHAPAKIPEPGMVHFPKSLDFASSTVGMVYADRPQHGIECRRWRPNAGTRTQNAERPGVGRGYSRRARGHQAGSRGKRSDLLR